MGFFKNLRSKGDTYDGQGDERKGFIDNVFVNLEKGCIVHRHPYDNLSTHAKVTVQEGQQMVFMSEGMYSNLFMPGGHTLSTNNIPFLEKIVNIPYGGQSCFKTSLYIVSTTRQRLAGDDAGWGVGLTIRDYSLSDEGVTIKVGAFGSYEFRITNAIAFIREYMGTQHDIYLNDFCAEFNSAVSQRVTAAISRYFSKNKVGITEVNNYLFELAEFARRELNEYLEDYGLELTKFDVDSVNPHEDDPNYRQLMQAQSDAGTMDLESRALARKRQREGYSYQQERQLDVMETAAGNEGMAGTMIGAGMGLGMGVGIGGTMGAQMGNIAQEGMRSATAAPPPPVTSVQIYVYLNNQQAGPYDMPILQQLVIRGVLTRQTLVWKEGMPAWATAETVPELQSLFASVPPPVPPVPPVPPTM
ncbi:SPFH domain-containing protein [Bacteroides pyogenes]|uniref:SPFH domain-containing protein n=1 Tax=Bacteroides pyogenes TaxID=310300 RepID=UPI00242C7795